MTTSNIIQIVLAVVPFIIIYIMKLQKKADKADTTELIETELKKKMKPVEDEIISLKLQAETDRGDISDLKIKSQRQDDRFQMIMDMLEKIPETMDKHYERIEKIVNRQDKNNRDSLNKLDDKIDKKADK